MIRSNAVDTANGGLAASFLGAFAAGWTVADWAALAALTYSVILIADKLGILNPLRALVVRFFVWTWGKVVRRGE